MVSVNASSVTCFPSFLCNETPPYRPAGRGFALLGQWVMA